MLDRQDNIPFQEHKPSHAKRLEIASIETWLHEEDLRIPADSNPHNETVEVRVVKHSDDETEKKPAQQESSGDATDQSDEDEVSSEETRIDEADLPRATIELPKL